MNVRPVTGKPRRPRCVQLRHTYGHALKGEDYPVINTGRVNDVRVYVVLVDDERKVVVPVQACKET